MSRIEPNSLTESVLFRKADKLLSGEYCEPGEIIELQSTLMSGEGRGETLRQFVFEHWREIESGFISVEDGTGRMPYGLECFLSFDRVFLRPLATRISDDNLRQFVEVGLKHLYWLGQVGPLSEDHVQVARHGANLLKWTVGKFLVSSRRDAELAERLSQGINGLLAWVSTPPGDLNGAVRSFQAADEFLRADLPWEHLDCRAHCQQVFLQAQSVLRLNGYFNRASGSVWEGKSEANSVDLTDPDREGTIEWLSDTSDPEVTFSPDVTRLMCLAEGLYGSSVEILLRCASLDDLSFWTDFLEQTPTDIDLYAYGIQALCLIDEGEFRHSVVNLVHKAVSDPYSVRNLIGLRVMELIGVWSSDDLLVSAVAEAIESLERPDRDKMILLVLDVSDRFGPYFEGAFSGIVRQEQAYSAALELADILFPNI